MSKRGRLSRVPPWNAHVGAIVRSRYRRPWVGVIVEVTERSYKVHRTESPLCHVVVVWDARGNRVTRRNVRRLDQWWLLPCERTLPADINPDWLRPFTRRV